MRRVVLIGVLIAAFGCAGPLTEQKKAEGPLRQWPPVPALARIIYKGSLKGPNDVGARRSWFSRLWRTIAGKEEGRDLEQPYGVFCDGKGRLFVTDTKRASVFLFDVPGKNFREWRRAGDDDLVSPIGIVGDGKDRVYVADSALNKVFVFSVKGKFLNSMGDTAGLNRPTGLALGSDGPLYVSDTLNHRIVVLDGDGSVKFTFGTNGTGKGQFNFPTLISIRDKKLFVSDSMNFRVQVFHESGEYITSFGKNGDGAGDMARSKGVTADSDGNIYVVDALFDVIQIYNITGTFLMAFGGSGSGDGDLWLPAGITTGPHNEIYAADSYNKRIQMYQYVPTGGPQ